MAAKMKIGQLSKRTTVGIETIRFYEKEGLLEPVNRISGSGYREYDDGSVARLAFVRSAKDLGFSLREIRDLLSLKAQTKGKCKSVMARAKLKLLDVDQKILELKKIRQSLDNLISKCNAEEPTSECPILGSMEGVKNESN